MKRTAAIAPELAHTGPGSAHGLLRYGEPVPPVTGKYRTRNPALVTTLKLMDRVGALHRKPDVPLPDRPLRVLVANWAHLGDVVMTLPLLQHLATHRRVGMLGVLVGSWSRGIVSGLPFVGRVHCLDHFFLDRGPGARGGKVLRYFARSRAVAREIRDMDYDVSIDLFSFFPATHRLLWKAAIPTRIGFESAGLGEYLTHRFGWTTEDEYMLVKQLRLLRPVLGEETPISLPASYPAFAPQPALPGGLTAERRYVLLHIGSGDMRSWTLPNWLELGRALKERECDVVFTGSKGREADIADEVAAKLGAQSVAGLLSWNEFVSAVANAAAVISVDTVTGHLAACFGTPGIVLMSGRAPSQLVRPNNAAVTTLVHPVGCSPCNRSRGCDAMACVKLISPADVLSVFDRIAVRSPSVVRAHQ
jgi:ADP-heptose:LPS heptosyltransferase